MEKKEVLLKTVKEVEEELIAFSRKLVQIPSITGREELAARSCYEKMQELGYDDVLIDDFGNVLGRIGDGSVKILMDAHLDVVDVPNPEAWAHDPFSGLIEGGFLFGRGSVDTKTCASAMIYAGAIAEKLGLLEGKTLYVSTSVMEEDYDDALLDALLTGQGIMPDYAVIGEPSSLQIARGHRGRAMFVITAKGVSAHGSMPQEGVNAVYKVAEIIRRVEKLQSALGASEEEAGSIALTKIESRSASLNAVPDLCDIYVDRRLALGENEEVITKEMNELVRETDCTWRVYDAEGVSWKGLNVKLHTFLPAWETDLSHPLVRAAVESYEELIGEKAPICHWKFATTAFATASKRNIPTIGFGPGDIRLAHKVDEKCPIDNIAKACALYVNLVSRL